MKRQLRENDSISNPFCSLSITKTLLKVCVVGVAGSCPRDEEKTIFIVASIVLTSWTLMSFALIYSVEGFMRNWTLNLVNGLHTEYFCNRIERLAARRIMNWAASAPHVCLYFLICFNQMSMRTSSQHHCQPQSLSLSWRSLESRKSALARKTSSVTVCDVIISSIKVESFSKYSTSPIKRIVKQWATQSSPFELQTIRVPWFLVLIWINR